MWAGRYLDESSRGKAYYSWRLERIKLSTINHLEGYMHIF